jgi:hypothetical protein
MQMLDFKMNEKHPCSKPLCVGYIISANQIVVPEIALIINCLMP